MRSEVNNSKIVFSGLVVLFALYFMHAILFFQYVNDDAHITFRYSYFLTQGYGPVFNPGEHVEGYSNFLMMLIAALVIVLGGRDAVLPFAKGLGLAAGLGAILVAFFLTRAMLRQVTGRREYGDYGGLITAGLLAANPGFALNSMSGLETTLSAFLLIAGLAAGILAPMKSRWCGAGIWFALALLTRPEASYVFALYFAGQGFFVLFSFWKSGIAPRALLKDPTARFLLLDAVVVLSVFSGHLLFRYAFYDGEFLPNTYFAKRGTPKGMIALRYIHEGALRPVFGIAGVLSALAGLILGRGSFVRILPLALVGIGSVLLPLITGIDWMVGYRLLVPALPIFFVLVVCGWFMLLSRLFRARTLVAICALVLIPVAWIDQSPEREYNVSKISREAAEFRFCHKALSEWLCGEETPQGRSIALMDIGVIGYMCPEVQITDISGLTDRFIAKSEGNFLELDYDPAYVLDKKPDLLVLIFSNQSMDRQNAYDTWTPIEHRIYFHPAFQQHYILPEKDRQRSRNSLEKQAAFFGAQKVFSLQQKNFNYNLAVFRRRG